MPQASAHAQRARLGVGKAVVALPVELQGAAGAGAQHEGDEGIGGHGRVQLGGKDRLSVQPAAEAPDDAPRHQRPLAVGAVAGLHRVGDQGTDLDHLAGAHARRQGDEGSDAHVKVSRGCVTGPQPSTQAARVTSTSTCRVRTRPSARRAAATTFCEVARRMRVLTPEEMQSLFAGGESEIAAVEKDYGDVVQLVEGIRDPRLLALCRLFLQEFGTRFQRAAAARQNHHAHRGGLLRQTGQMMRTADALCSAYPNLNRGLLLAGVLFHDCGKLWEVCPPESGFEIPRELRGELLGHISIGIELVNTLWRKLPLEEWRESTPSSEDVRMHLLHLIAAHHGELQFGSPVEPKTPEAIALNMVDNLDARLEMISAAYVKQPEIAPGIHERVRTLNTSPVKPLAAWE